MAGKKQTSKPETGIKLDEEWRVESDMRTLMTAEEIKADPKRFAKVRAMAKQKMIEAAKLAGSAADE